MQCNYLPSNIAQHAEYKAIASYKGTKALSGCTLYVTTAPCNICAKLIAQSGIVEVVYKKDCAYVTGSGKKALNCEKRLSDVLSLT